MEEWVPFISGEEYFTHYSIFPVFQYSIKRIL